MQFSKILIVCTGNICRSPMAEALLRKRLGETERGAFEISSAGLGALVGHSADEKAVSVMGQKAIDITHHQGRQINDEMVRQADLILVMESDQKRTVELTWPFSRGKVYRLGEWGGFDIEDPYRKNEEAFREAFERIEKGVEQWLARLLKS